LEEIKLKNNVQQTNGTRNSKKLGPFNMDGIAGMINIEITRVSSRRLK